MTSDVLIYIFSFVLFLIFALCLCRLLSFNQITHINRRTFSGLKNLRSL